MGLVRADNKERLKELSQHGIWNAFCSLPFGKHNNCGVHSATPMDLLHWVQLNMCKYNREAFFTQVGDKTKLSALMVGLAQTCGVLLQRQSDRDMPRSTFSGGIRGSYLQAHEMTGVMLVLAVCIRSRAGRDALRTLGHGCWRINTKRRFEISLREIMAKARVFQHTPADLWLRKAGSHAQ